MRMRNVQYWTTPFFFFFHDRENVTRRIRETNRYGLIVALKMNIDLPEETIKLFFQSCEDGSLATVQQLLTQHSNLEVSIIDDNENTALIIASENGRIGIVKLLLECGANVDKKNSSGWTVVSRATPLNREERGVW